MAWTETTRAHYRRDGLRYASDMTDAEWALLRPCCRHHADWAGRGRPICAEWWRRSSIFCRRVVSGARCRGSFRHIRRFKAISIPGAIPEGGKRSSRFWCVERDRSSGARQSQRPPSLTAKAHRRLTPAARADTTRVSVFTGANAISSPTRTDFSSPSMFTRQTSRTAMAQSPCWSG